VCACGHLFLFLVRSHSSQPVCFFWQASERVLTQPRLACPEMAKGPKREASAAASSSVKRSRTLTPEAVVAQKLRDTYKTLGPTETDSLKGPDGRTLRERLLHDYLRWLDDDSTVVWGRTYHCGLKSVYKRVDNIDDLLRAKNRDLQVRQALISAQLQLNAAKPDRSGYEAFFLSCQDAPNEKEMCGIWRFLVHLRIGCAKQHAVGVQGLRFVARFSLHVTFAEQWQHVKSWADEVVCKMLRVDRRAGGRDVDFIDNHAELVELLCPPAALKKVAAAKGSWGALSDVLNALVTSSELGKLLYADHQAKVVEEQVQKQILDDIHGLFSKKEELTEAKIADGKTKTMTALDAIPGLNLLPGRRQVQVLYRGHHVPVHVTSLVDEVHLKYSAALKSCGVRAGILSKLWVEDNLVDETDVCEMKATVPKSLLKQAGSARSQIREMVKSASISSSDAMQKLLGSKSASLLLADSSFKLELSLLGELTRSDEHSRVRQAALECLPSDKLQLSLETSVQRLHVLSGTDLMKLSTRSSQEKVKILQGILTAIGQSRAPDLRAIKVDDFVASAAARCGYFCTYRASDEDAAKPVFGSEALLKLLDAAEAKAKKNALELEDVAILKTFNWLLNDAQQKRVTELAKVPTTKSSGKSAASKGSSASSSAPSSSSAAPLKAKSEKSAMQRAMDAFA
jgi:hypothetical protein